MEQRHEIKLSTNTAGKSSMEYSTLFDIKENELALIANGTYILIEQPLDYNTQRRKTF